MASIRLSKDVEESAKALAEEFGLSSIKDAVEAVFRTQHQHYGKGNCSCSDTPVIQTAIDTPIDVASALDAVL